MSNKKNIAAGFDMLIPAAPAGSKEEAKKKPAQAEPARSYKTVCYSLPVELADKVRKIAYWDRKKLNAVVSEALAAYCDSWTPKADTPQTL